MLIPKSKSGLKILYSFSKEFIIILHNWKSPHTQETNFALKLLGVLMTLKTILNSFFIHISVSFSLSWVRNIDELISPTFRDMEEDGKWQKQQQWNLIICWREMFQTIPQGVKLTKPRFKSNVSLVEMPSKTDRVNEVKIFLV